MNRRVICIGAAFALLAGLVVADVAMPRGKWTPIRMTSEHVTIALGRASVKVEATFVLENGKDPATVVVGYPRGVLEKSLDDFAVTVDGEKVAVSSQKGGSDRGRMRGDEGPSKPGVAQKYAYQFDGPYPEWKTFEVKFPEKGRRTVVVRYSVAPAEVETESGKLLTYVYTLKTGATWSGNIDKAVIEALIDGVEVVSKTPANPTQKLEGMKPFLVWTFKDFKPTQDIEITFKAK